MKTVTILHNHDTRVIFSAVCWYAEHVINKSKNINQNINPLFDISDNCDHSVLEVFGEKNISLAINKTVFIKCFEISITPVLKGEPVGALEYHGLPKIYKELVLQGLECDILNFIKEAKVEYDKKCLEFEKSDTHIIILTWTGSIWHDEYKTPKRSNKSIYLPDDSYTKVLDDLKSFYDNTERYKQLEIPYTRTYMLHGLPGTGKTSMIYTIATELNKNIAIIDFSDKDMCDTCIRQAVYKLPANTILCLEDMDTLFSSDRKSDKSTITFSGILNILDGVIKNTGLVIFMTTNLLQNIDDKAMKRRVDYYLKFDLMKKDQIENMFKHFYPNQDFKNFIKLVSKLQLTPCILQKFFVRHLMCDNILEYIEELNLMCEQDYKIINNTNSLYI